MGADFSGWATKNGLKCSDGRTIMSDAFKHQDKKKIPLVWQHQHNEPTNVLGHAILENRKEGVYAYGYFNDTNAGQEAKKLVMHGDIESLSIWANQLQERNKDVYHGDIKELSLVISGANPGAFIDNIYMAHGDEEVLVEGEGILYTGLTLEHEDKPESASQDNQGATMAGEDGEETIKEVYDTLSDKQKNVVHFLIGEALDAAEKSGSSDVQHADEEDGAADDDVENEDQEDNSLQHNQEGSHMNVFDGESKGDAKSATLSHSQLMTIVEDGKKNGSFKEALLAHAEDYGITNIELLFPDAKTVDNSPEWITRKMEWVTGVLAGVKKLPFSKIKSMSADLTHEEARAKGYIKEGMKKEQFFSLAKRETGPKTIYKKQKLDRDDIIDITEIDVVTWIWQEMRFMLNEEIARAILIGDGREVDDEDKIDEDKIRPIAHDDPFYTDVIVVPAEVSGDGIIEAVLRGRPNYKGAGNPTAFMTEDVLTDLILLKDKLDRRLYPTQQELESAMRVSNIVTVPIMDGHQTDDGELLIVLVNLSDYSVGTTKGGEISTFEDFDIDYNQYKYLIEGRMSGALTRHKSAQVVVRANGTEVTPTVPTFVSGTGVVTIPTKAGVVYKNSETGATLTAGAQTALASGDTLSVDAVPAAGYYFPHNFDADWSFTRP